jgi:hypothetical protein
LFASIMICTLAGGCSGATRVSPARPAAGSAATAPDRTALDQLALPKLKLGANGNVNPHTFTPVAVPYIGSSSHRRSTKATVQTANEQQTTGITFSPNDSLGAQATDINFLGSAGTNVSLPNPASGTNYLISPDTVVGVDSCIELKTVYFRNAGDPGTTAQMRVFDSCTQTEYLIATIDANFMATYTHDYGINSGQQYYADIRKVGATWQVFLNNFVTNLFDNYYTAPGAAPSATSGQSTFNINTFAVGICPSLPSQNAEAFQIATSNGTGAPVWATMAPYSPNAPRNASGAADCFDSGVSTNPYFYYVRFGNGTPGYAKWAVYTSSAAPSPSPTPTATPTATPTPVPTATPTPTPVPTATPTPNPRIFIVTQNTSTLTARKGMTTVFPCWVTIRTYDPIEERIRVVTGSIYTAQGYGAFPVMASPTPSYVSWSVPDVAPGFTVLNNSTNASVQTMYFVLRGLDQTHCVDLSINVPSTIALGTYPSNVAYAGYARVSPTGGLYALYGRSDVLFNVVVTP